MNIYAASAYTRHLFTARSTAGYGVHSPYMFDFITKVMRGRCDERLVAEVESLRKEILADRRTVTVTDLGAGSSRFSGAERKISDIAAAAALSKKEADLLARIVMWTEWVEGTRDQGSGIILELGTSLGISTLALALAAPDTRVVTVEGCPALAEIARGNLRRHTAHNAEVLNMEFNHALTKLRAEGTTVSLAFIDGNHTGEALKKYVHQIMMMGEEMIIVADDIHMNRDMFMAWRSLTTNETTPAALETFRLGILFRIRSLTPGYYRVMY